MAASAFRQFRFLMWKEWLIMKRRFSEVLGQIALIVVMSVIFIYSGMTRTHGREETEATQKPPWDPLRDNPCKNEAERETVYYSPSTGYASRVMQNATGLLNELQNITYDAVGLASEDDLLIQALNVSGKADMIAVVFENVDPSTTSPPSWLKFKIRSTQTSVSTVFTNHLRGPNSHDGGYNCSGFLALQAAIERSHIEQLSRKSPEWVLLQPFPHPPYLEVGNVIPLFIMVGVDLVLNFSFVFYYVILKIVQEKEKGHKEMMRLMGMDNFPYWLSVFLSNVNVIIIFCTIMFILFNTPLLDILRYSDKSVLFVLLMLSGASSLAFSMALTPFFKRAIWAVIGNVLINVLGTFTLPMILMEPFIFKTPASYSAKLASCLFPNMALYWGLRVIGIHESMDVAVSWSNLFHYPFPDEKISVGLIMLILLASTPLYLAILLYVDAVWPWQDGIPKPFYFPLQKSYWFGDGTKSQTPLEELDPPQSVRRNSYVEEEPPDLVPGIRIINLTKVFVAGGYAKEAVSNVYLNAYRGQITVLLGHNGAGKTTVMNMITGMFTPTSGTVRINGHDILTETKAARESLGLCKQIDTLFDELTVSEHLTLFAGLKGCTGEKLREQVSETLRIVNLEDKRNNFPNELSGGMKRKLCLAIAYIGDSKVLILDEPTSGMDPEARRNVWNMLQQLRETRTVLLTTHLMEEADVLGDRIAIMDNGNVKCCGSPMFLKRKLGTGYQLRVAKESEACNTAQVTSLILKYLPESNLLSDEGTELLYALGWGSPEQFPALFETLQKSKIKLGIASFGVSASTMQDVFLKVGHKHYEDAFREDASETFSSHAMPALTGLPRLAQQFRGLLIKRARYAKQDWKVTFLHVLLSYIFWTLMLLQPAYEDEDRKLTCLTLDLESLFGQTESFYVAEGSKHVEEYYVHLLQSMTEDVKKVDNATSFILDIAKKDMEEYSRKYITGGEFPLKGNFVISWYNTEPYHTAPVALSLMDTALLRMAINDSSENSSARFEVSSHPFPSEGRIIFIPTSTDFYKILLPGIMTFLSLWIFAFPVVERKTKVKLLQLMCGVNCFVFWGASFLWDFGVQTIISSLFMGIVVACDKEHIFIDSATNLGALFILLQLYDWCFVPFAYLLSFIMNDPEVGPQVFLFFMMFLVPALIHAVDYLHQEAYIIIYKILLNVGRIIPAFAVTEGVVNLKSFGRTVKNCKKIKPFILDAFCVSRDIAIKKGILACCADICDGEGCVTSWNPFSMGDYGCGQDMIFLLITGIVFFLIVNLLDGNYARSWLSCSGKQPEFVATELSGTEDSDVAAEYQRVNYLFVQDRVADEAMVVLNLTKEFSSFFAVKQLTFGVHKKECFGLLGVNGAGKTTTLRMLIGDLRMTEGNAYIGKYDLKSKLKKFQSHVGYCPQVDPLLDNLTGREMLYLFARLRGIEEDNIMLIVNELVKRIDLEEHVNNVTKHYSGGTRRKLSLAIALIGCPPILFLDEPTSGVDPVGRHKIWSTLREVQKVFDASIILTSHSMEECEMLCSRLAIMVNGQFRCIGGLQHLRTKFAQGYTIIAKLKKETTDDAQAAEQVKQYIEKEFPSASLKDEHQGFLQYHVTDSTVSWSKLFSKMEEAKRRFQVEDFTVSDTTLEQIFLMFARSQRNTAQNPGESAA